MRVSWQLLPTVDPRQPKGEGEGEEERGKNQRKKKYFKLSC